MRHPPIGPQLRRELNSALFSKHANPPGPNLAGHPAEAIFRRMNKAFMKLTWPPRMGFVYLTLGPRPGRECEVCVNLTKGARPRVKRRALQRILAKAAR